MTVRIIQGDCIDELRKLPAASVHCCVTSPPYWGLRDYKIPSSIWGGDPACEHAFADESVQTEVGKGKGNWAQGVNGRGELQPGGVDAKREPIRAIATRGFCRCGAWRGSFGLEPTPGLYVEHAVMVFREVRRVLRDDGTLWLNLGDSYATGAGKALSPGGGEQGERFLESGPSGYRGAHDISGKHAENTSIPTYQPNRMPIVGLKPKDLVGVPWRVAFALQADGWYLRQDIIWAKPNPMPESVRDRCTKAHEYLFLLAQSERYYYDADAIKEESITGDARKPYAPGQVDARGNGHDRNGGALRVRSPAGWKTGKGAHGSIHADGREQEVRYNDIDATTRNKRSVWTVATQPFKEAHFATFPPALIEPCILAGCPVGGTVLDPFGGAGTTGLVADRLQRNAILIELNADYAAMAEKRIHADGPLFASVTA